MDFNTSIICNFFKFLLFLEFFFFLFKLEIFFSSPGTLESGKFLKISDYSTSFSKRLLNKKKYIIYVFHADNENKTTFLQGWEKLFGEIISVINSHVSIELFSFFFFLFFFASLINYLLYIA